MKKSKVCFKCTKRKLLSGFYTHPGMSDGYLGKCKECIKIDGRVHRSANIDRYRKYDKERALEPHRVAARKAYASSERGREIISAGKKRWEEKNWEKILESHRRNSRMYPHKKMAHYIVGNAIRDGKLVRKPCEKCGSTKLNHAHHEDYTKPLDVIWLCRPCHIERHKELRRLGVKLL